MSADPKAGLVQQIEKQVDLFQTTIGKSNTNTVSTVTMILQSMGQTILAQYDEIQRLNGEVENLKKNKLKESKVEPPKKNTPKQSVPDEITT